MARIDLTAPIILSDGRLNINPSIWQMLPGEQLALVYFLQNLRPQVAIEIGTQHGGSLQIISHFSKKVYSLDINPEVPNRLAGKYLNTEYIVGNSATTLPLLLEKLEQEKTEMSFILVDGDHSMEGLKRDLGAILKFKPYVPLYVLIHDSFNPNCRKAIVSTDWNSCPYVHLVEVDYIPGIVHSDPSIRGELWGGMSLAIFSPEPRQGKLEVQARNSIGFSRSR